MLRLLTAFVSRDGRDYVRRGAIISDTSACHGRSLCRDESPANSAGNQLKDWPALVRYHDANSKVARPSQG